MNDAIGRENITAKDELRAKMRSILNLTSSGWQTSKRNAKEAGREFTRLNQIYFDAINKTKGSQPPETPGKGSHILAGLEDYHQIQDDVRISPHITEEDFQSSEFSYAFDRMSTFNWTSYENYPVNEFFLIFYNFKIIF